MVKPFVILMQKMSDGAEVKDSLSDFNMVCTDFPFKIGGKTKELPKREWEGEDGEDTYIPSVLPLEAYDIEVGMCYKGSVETAYDGLIALRDYLTGVNGDGSALKVYNGHTGVGRQGIYMLSMDDDVELTRMNDEDVVLFNIKFRVTDPKTEISPSISGGTVVGLV